jgi:hypothetical protein
MEDDFKLTSNQYSIIVLAFFISYLVFEVPANMILTRVRPSVFLPGLGLIWGTFAALMGATNNWSQLAGMRFLLGFAEVCFILIPRLLGLAYPFFRPASLLAAPSSCRPGIESTSSQQDTPFSTPQFPLLAPYLAFSLVSSPSI